MDALCLQVAASGSLGRPRKYVSQEEARDASSAAKVLPLSPNSRRVQRPVSRRVAGSRCSCWRGLTCTGMDAPSTSGCVQVAAFGSFGRPRKYASKEEARDARNAARRARRQAVTAAAVRVPLSPNSRRAKRAASMREKRQSNPDIRKRESNLKKQQRSLDRELRHQESEEMMLGRSLDPELRQREAEAMKRKLDVTSRKDKGTQVCIQVSLKSSQATLKPRTRSCGTQIGNETKETGVY